MEYVTPSVARTKAYAENISAFVAQIVELAFCEPKWFVKTVVDGLDKLLSLPKYKPWLDDYQSRYGVNVNSYEHHESLIRVLNGFNKLGLPEFVDVDEMEQLEMVL